MSSPLHIGESPLVRLVKQVFLSAVQPVRPNPSIEGTCNIWLRQLSPAPHVKR
jgi:hypothetical protein